MSAFAFIFGACVGSFANVCIHRMPNEKSIVHPRSMCSRCGTPIRFYDNIPCLSWFLLMGRCRACGQPFSFRYPFLELVYGAIALWIYRRHGFSIVGVYSFVLISALLIASVIDLEHRIIPDSISIGGIWVGLAAAGICAWIGFPWFIGWKEAAVGALSAWLFLWLTGWAYEKITGREGIGFGDVKLLSLIGAHSGVEGAFSALFYGSLSGSIVGLLMMVVFRKDRRYPIPFGPFLCLGFLLHVLKGSPTLFLF
jgi:leader peptidase (prepilin peptidase) / N-methyltransferase